MREHVMRDFPAHKEEHEKALKRWQDRGEPEPATDEAAAAASVARPAEGQGEAVPGPEMIVVIDHDSQPTGTADSGSLPPQEQKAPAADDNAEPTKKWRFTEDQREEIFTIVHLENAISELKNEK